MIKTNLFNDYFCMFCPARKGKKFGRPIGGVAVYYKNINEKKKKKKKKKKTDCDGELVPVR